VKDLFKDLPVRLIEFKKGYKSQYSKAIGLLQSYAIIGIQTKLTVMSSQGDNMPFTNVIRTNSRCDNIKYESDLWLKALGENLVSVLGK